MNDKAKKILSYVACALGGACLGIALLGGLSYCSTSSAREKADTINTIAKVKRNADAPDTITFTPFYSTDYPTAPTTAGQFSFYYYDFRDNDHYSFSGRTKETVSITSYSSFYSEINTRYNAHRDTNKPRFMAVIGTISGTLPLAYYSFIEPTSDWTYPGSSMLPFIFTNKPSTGRIISLNDTNLANNSATDLYVLNMAKCNYWLYNGFVSQPVFRDVKSYFYYQGSENGYSEGYTTGNSEGYSSGYNDGYEEGSSAGYESGYDQGFQEGYMNTYYAFTSLIANRNAIWSMTDIPWHSNEDIYIAPGHLNDHPFLDPAILQTNTYVNWAYLALFRDTTTLIPYYIYAQRYTTSQNNGYVNFVIRISPADQTSTENAGNIGSYSGGVSLSETSIFQTEYVTEWTAPNRCQLIAWGSEDPQDIDTNWFDNGHILPRGIAVDESAYDQGYRQGQLDAQRNTSMNNVFALFTPAFGAVASFFDMKIFGFLPLYWFLIAPLFIALISLIMRMVKH